VTPTLNLNTGIETTDEHIDFVSHPSETKFILYPTRKKKTHLQAGSGLPFGGRPHAISRSRHKVHARLGRCGSFTLLELDDRVLTVLLLAFGGVEKLVEELELFTSKGAQPDRFVGFIGCNGRGSGAGRGTLRPMAVNGGPLSPKANGFSFGSSDGVLVIMGRCLGIDDS
jgi:hypothetical protein